MKGFLPILTRIFAIIIIVFLGMLMVTGIQRYSFTMEYIDRVSTDAENENIDTLLNLNSYYNDTPIYYETTSSGMKVGVSESVYNETVSRNENKETIYYTFYVFDVIEEDYKLDDGKDNKSKISLYCDSQSQDLEFYFTSFETLGVSTTAIKKDDLNTVCLSNGQIDSFEIYNVNGDVIFDSNDYLVSTINLTNNVNDIKSIGQKGYNTKELRQFYSPPGTKLKILLFLIIYAIAIIGTYLLFTKIIIPKIKETKE